jgi:hypothetical protein
MRETAVLGTDLRRPLLCYQWSLGGDGSGTKKETQMAEISQGTKVTWNWGQGTASGTVQKTYAKSITRSLKCTEVTRNGTKDDPALLIEQEDGDEVLKLSSEVDIA